MNRSVNIFLLVLSFPARFFAIVVCFDLSGPFYGGSASVFPHRELVFLSLAGLLLLIVGRRSVSRWVGVGMMRKPERFIWCVPIGKERKKQVRLFLWIETIVALLFALVAYWLTPEAWPLQIVYGLLFLDQLIFLIVADKWYRVGITHKALVVADREVRVFYFSGLRRVEVHQQTVYFEYIEDLQLFFPVNCIEQDQYPAFRDALESKLNRDKVFFSEKFKEL